ncbi:MAG: anchored repeat ABC transporter, substrate-binding protein [Actinomycetota bacterium]
MTRVLAFGARSLPIVLLGLFSLAGCTAPPTLSALGERLQVVTTTPILRDLVSQVGGERVTVVSLVPEGADPHSYEPSLRAIRNVAYADVAFSNYLLLEQHGIIKALDANLADGTPNISLAEASVRYAAEIIPLVENVSLDTIWLGMRVRGSGERLGADRASEVLLRTTGVSGPGKLFAYLTESFGRPVFYINSADGFNPANSYRDDTATLPTDAHTHMSWAFSEPGIYRLEVEAVLAVDSRQLPVPMGKQRFTFAVGVDPQKVPGMEVLDVLSGGHADIAVDLDDAGLYLFADPHGAGESGQHVYDAATTVIEVPNKAMVQIPGDPAYRFLGRPGSLIHQLPQAVLGRHVHGEIDPHLWHNVRNVIAYVKLIRDTLISVDPAGVSQYQAGALAYIKELEDLDNHVRSTIEQIPPAQRHLVTTHDAFGYLAQAYGIQISGFVSPNPSTEPSVADRIRLTRTIRNLKIPAVFLEPNLLARSSTLTQLAREQGVRTCRLYGDNLDAQVTSYVQMMLFNAASLLDCLA